MFSPVSTFPGDADQLPRPDFDSGPPWEPPLSLDDPPLPPFPVHSLPPWLRDFVLADAQATQTPTDLAGVLALAVVATACARTVEVHLWGDWYEPVNLFALVALTPGHRTNAVFADLVAPLRNWEYDADPRRALDNLPTGPVGLVESMERKFITWDPRPRLLVDDCTPDLVLDLLFRNRGRIALFSPTGSFLDLLPDRLSSRNPGFGPFLSAYAGDPINLHRVGDQPELIYSPAVTLVAAASPDVLRRLILRRDPRARGLPARFLYAMPSSTLGHRKVDVPTLQADVFDRYHERVRLLVDIFHWVDNPARLTLTAPAVHRLQRFAADLEPRLGDDGDLADLVEWAALLPGLVARLTALLHLADRVEQLLTPDDNGNGGFNPGPSGPSEDSDSLPSAAPSVIPAPFLEPIDTDTVSAACTLGEYAIAHARAAFSFAGDDSLADARYLRRAILRLDRPQVTRQQIWQATKSKFRNVRAMDAALAQLVERDYLRILPTQPRVSTDGSLVRGRRPAPIYLLNPFFLTPSSPNPSLPSPAKEPPPPPPDPTTPQPDHCQYL